MSNLYTFGCSFTEGFIENHPPYQEYKKFRGGSFPKHWTELLSEKLGCNLINDGKGGSGNQHIFTSLCKRANQLKKNDVVIVQWSFMNRFRLSDSEGITWVHVGPSDPKHIGNNGLINFDCQDMICINRSLKPYLDEIYDFERIIDRLSKEIGFDVYYWTIINELIYNQPKETLSQRKYLLNDKIKDQFDNTFSVILKNGGLRVVEETNGQIDDWHMGESGNRVQAELFYEHIKNS
jgi:hypothetical protein